MSLQVNGNAGAVNWDALLSKLGEVTKTEGADGVAGSTNVTITRTVDGVETPVTIRIPDDLDIPETVDQAAIDSLCQKLAADTSLNLTEEQIKLFHDTLSETLTKTLAAMPKDSAQSNIRRAMFDLYKMMALLVEVAQKQRDATREMRLAENLAVQKSILDQAEAQRTAAITGMIAGAICCALQSAATFISLYQQAKAFNAQLGTEKTAGLDVAGKNVDMMKAANNQADRRQAVPCERPLRPERSRDQLHRQRGAPSGSGEVHRHEERAAGLDRQAEHGGCARQERRNRDVPGRGGS